LGYTLQKHLNDLRAVKTEKLVDLRYERLRHLGVYEEAGEIRS
jgi:acetyl-CoA carboxylase carboxyl transferase subunit alpha